jgi:hypothetical protein
MSARRVNRHDNNMLRKWFGANRGTHWSIAGSIAVIIFGSYLIYNSRDRNPTAVTLIPAAEQTQVPVAPGPVTLK